MALVGCRGHQTDAQEKAPHLSTITLVPLLPHGLPRFAPTPGPCPPLHLDQNPYARALGTERLLIQAWP
jgi:hypothetical protein